jgi:1,4-alpha-glucan branching enzyme
MLTKGKLTRGKAKVAFNMPALESVNALYLVGDFNNWSIQEHPMERGADGSWSVTVALEPGSYQFRYFDGNGWHNDWQADSYMPNQYGGDNSVVTIEAVATKKAASAPRKKAAEGEKPKKASAPRKKKAE